MGIDRNWHNMHNQIILATGGYDHTIKLWRAETKDCIKSMQHPDSVSTKHTHHHLKTSILNFQSKHFTASECVGSHAR